MSERIQWGILIFSALFACFLALVLRSYLQVRGKVEIRRMLHTERLAAIEKGLPSPEEKQSDSQNSVTVFVLRRLETIQGRKILCLLGVLLLASGAGAAVAIFVSNGALHVMVVTIVTSLGLGLIALSILFKKRVLD